MNGRRTLSLSNTRVTTVIATIGTTIVSTIRATGNVITCTTMNLKHFGFTQNGFV